MSKNTTTPKGAGASTPEPKQAQTTPAPMQVVNQVTSQEQTPEELRQEIERLKAQLSKSPENFDERVKYYQRKQELIKRLQQLETTHGVIKQHLQVTTKEPLEWYEKQDAKS